MTRLFLGLLFLGGFFSISSSFAIETTPALSLGEAVSQANEHSPLLQKKEAERSEGKWRQIEGTSVFLPTVTLSGTHFFEKRYQYLNIPGAGGTTTVFPQIFPTTSGTLSAKWLLFDGLANVNTFQAANKAKSAAEKEYEWAKYQLEREVSLAYSKIIAAKKLDDVAEENLKTLENHLSQVKNLEQGGVATHYDVLRVESQLSEAQAELLQAKDNIEIAKEKLGQLLGLEAAIDVTENELHTPSAEKVTKLTFKNDSEQRLDITAFRDRVDASLSMDRANNRFWMPKIGMLADYIQYNNLTNSMSDWSRYRTAWSAGFFLSWELFNPRAFAQGKEETYKAIQNEKALQSTLLQAPVDFAFWKKRYLYSAKLYDAKKSDLERATETVRLAQAGFKAGVRTTTEVLDAELDLFRARAGIVNAQMNATEAKIKLELALGESI